MRDFKSYNRVPTHVMFEYTTQGIFHNEQVILVLSIRPTVAEHAFYVFGRSIHPELLSIVRSRTIQRKNYSARIDITSDGHVVSLIRGSLVLSEVICSKQQSLPQKRRILGANIKGPSNEEIECKQGVHYRTQFELDHVGTDMFWMLQTQLQSCACQSELVHSFDSSGRIAIGAVSYIHIEESERQLLVQAFHTFPDDYAIVKSVSTFRVS